MFLQAVNMVIVLTGVEHIQTWIVGTQINFINAAVLALANLPRLRDQQQQQVQHFVV